VYALGTLSHALFEAGVIPYYLHLLDRVRGAAHFDLPESTAVALHDELARQLPGYLVPRLVREIPGANAKQPVRSSAMRLNEGATLHDDAQSTWLTPMT
jgi:L-lysine 2,3-aminomutase